jgi:hypothetical protein
MRSPNQRERRLTATALFDEGLCMDGDIQVKTYSPAKSLGDARRRAGVLLLVATLLASVLCAFIFVLVLKAEWLTAPFEGAVDFMFGKPVWAILAATSPLAAALLVGFGYMQRAIRRRGEERQAALEAHNGQE